MILKAASLQSSDWKAQLLPWPTGTFVPVILCRRMGFLFSRHERSRSAGCSGQLGCQFQRQDKSGLSWERATHVTKTAEMLSASPHITSSRQDQLNPSQPCQAPHSSHLLLWAMTSAQTKTSLGLRLCWTWRELSPGHAIPLLFPRFLQQAL